MTNYQIIIRKEGGKSLTGYSYKDHIGALITLQCDFYSRYICLMLLGHLNPSGQINRF